MRHDPMAARGAPAHITILFPFRFTLDALTLVTLLVEDDVGMWHVDRSRPLLPDLSPRHG